MSTNDALPDRTIEELASGFRFAMLTTDDPAGLESRPLTVQRVDDGLLWFLVASDAPWLPAACGVNVALVSDDLWVSVTGVGSTTRDPEVLELLGDPVSDAWFQEGADPVALKVEVQHGSWWDSPGFVRSALGVVRAKVTGATPDIGEHGVIA